MQNTDDPNAVATDLWRQIFLREAEKPFSTIIPPDYDPAVDEARMLHGFLNAGWLPSEVDKLLDNCRVAFAGAPVTSPGVAAHIELRHEHLCTLVENAMRALGIETYARTTRGIEPRLGVSAGKIGVIMTDQSIVTVSAFFFRFCGLIAKAYVRSLRLNPYLWESTNYNIEQGAALIGSGPDIIDYWIRIYLAFAIHGSNYGVPFLPCRRDELHLVEMVAESMELFAIAHEYGHHHLAHGRNVDEDPWHQEYEADQFALRVCAEACRSNNGLENPYLRSGAGGAILLRALEILRTVERRLGAPGESDDTHPQVCDRIRRFDSVEAMRPREFVRLRSFRLAGDRIFLSAATMIDDFIAGLAPDDISAFYRFRRSMHES
ncbi:hypothetical protein [Methylobacterium fujisawaense]|uniref:hypothetical protein n=1 Tax=Methylobacterium fujisawaense TaxID=107400 RepID=UPI00244D6562|nr:hypothetical protein [Methylobacterium fujisawaense]MDH3030148.1 hypothetical protein [Methylobacterium fujisawaense]